MDSGYIYQISKVHKNREWPPGRPIISGINSLYARVGEYLDLFLQPLAANGKYFLKDSKDTIASLQNVQVGDATILVPVDVESLYTNIKQP